MTSHLFEYKSCDILFLMVQISKHFRQLLLSYKARIIGFIKIKFFKDEKNAHFQLHPDCPDDL